MTMKQGISSPNQLMMMDDSSHASSVDQSHVITAMEELKTPFASWEDENNNSAQVDDATVYENASTDSSEVEEASLCSKMHSSSSVVKKNNNVNRELQESTHSYSQYPVISLSESQHSIVSGLTQMNFSHHDLKHSSHHGSNNGSNNKKKVDPKDDEIARLRQELFLLKQNVMKEGAISKDELVSCLDRIHEELGGGSNELKLEYGSEGDSSMADSDFEGDNASSSRRRKKSRSTERKKKDRSGSKPKRKKVRSPMRATTTTEQDSSSKTSTTSSVNNNNNNKTPKRRGSNGSSRRKYRTVKSNSSERSGSSPIDNEDLRKILKGDSSYLRMASLKEEQKEEQSISTRSTKSSTRSMGRSSSVGALHKKEHSSSTRSSSVGPLKEVEDATTSTRNSLLLQEVKEEDSKHLRSCSVGPDTSSRHLREVKEEDSSKHKRSSSMGPDTSSRHMRSLDVGPSSPTNTKNSFDPFLPKPARTRKEKEARTSGLNHFDLNDDTVGKRKKAPRRKSAPMNVTDFDAFLLRQASKEAEKEEPKQELQLNDVPLKRERGNFQKKAIRRQSAPMLFSTDFPLNLHLQQASLNHLSLDDDDDDDTASKDESKENTKSTASKSVASKSFGDDEETTKTTASKSLDEEEETSKELTISSDAKDAGSVKKKKKKKIIKNPNRRSSMSAVMTDLSGGITEVDLAADDSSAASSTRRRKKGTARKPKNRRASMEAIPTEMMTMKPSVEKNRRASMDLVPSKLVRQTTYDQVVVTSSNDLHKPTALSRQTTFDQVVTRYAPDQGETPSAASTTTKKSRTPRRASISDFTFVSEHSLVVEENDDKKKKKSSRKKKDAASQDAKVMEAFSASFAGFPSLQDDEEPVVAAVKRSKVQQAKRKSTKFLSKLADTAAIMSPRSKEKRKINLFGGDKSSFSSFAA